MNEHDGVVFCVERLVDGHPRALCFDAWDDVIHDFL